MVNTTSQSYNVCCYICSQEYNIIADRNDMEAWTSGDRYIQDCLSYLSPAERELLISRTCDKCWKHMYPEVDTEEQYVRICVGNFPTRSFDYERLRKVDPKQ